MKKPTNEEIYAMLEANAKMMDNLRAMLDIPEATKPQNTQRPETWQQKEKRESMEAKVKALAEAEIIRPELEKQIAAFRASNRTNGRHIIGLNGVPYPNKTAVLTYNLFCKFTDSAGPEASMRDASMEITQAIEDGVDPITAASLFHSWIMFYGRNSTYGEIRKPKAQRNAEKAERKKAREEAGKR